MTEFFAIPLVVMIAGIAGACFVATRHTRGVQPHIRLDRMRYQMGEAISAEISAETKGEAFDEAVLTLYCEERVELLRDGERQSQWRRLFSKSQSLRVDADNAGMRGAVHFNASMALPDCSRDDLKGVFSLWDMARIMRAQLSGEGLPSRRATDRPGERLLQLAERHRFDDSHWRLELQLLQNGRTLSSHRVDVPVRGFAKRAEETISEDIRRAA